MKSLRLFSLFSTLTIILVATQSSLAASEPKIFSKAIGYDSGGASASSVALADLNSDGYLDLVVAGSDGRVCVSLGNAGGTFHPPVVYILDTYPSVLGVAIADVNGDGHPDLIVSADDFVDSYAGKVEVLIGNGDGTFQTPTTYYSGGTGAYSVAIQDVNGDGRLDLILADGCQSVNCSTGFHGGVSVMLGNGDGSFQAATTYDSGGVQAQSVAVADINGDGY